MLTHTRLYIYADTRMLTHTRSRIKCHCSMHVCQLRYVVNLRYIYIYIYRLVGHMLSNNWGQSEAGFLIK